MQLVSKLPNSGLGQRLEIRVAERWWATRVEDCAEGLLTVAWPTDDRRALVPMDPGEVVELLRVVPGDGTYSVHGTVCELVTDSVPAVRVALGGEWQRSQRRGAFRARVAFRPRVAESHYRPLRLGITNVSASGVQVRSQDELRRGDLLHLVFDIDTEIELYARVGRVTRLERVWDAGCAFEGMSERLSERIVQFIFAQQRIALRARRGDA